MHDILIRTAQTILIMDDLRRELAQSDIVHSDDVVAAVGQGPHAPGAERAPSGCTLS